MDSESIKREFLRHTIATLAYRCGKVVQNVPEGFKDFKIGEHTRTPGEILAHLGDLIDWALRMSKGVKGGFDSSPLEWDKETERFFSLLTEFDDYLSSGKTVEVPYEKLFQGPVADSFTHVGQISLLRRLAGKHVRGENYFKAHIEIGRVGKEQSLDRFEFD